VESRSQLEKQADELDAMICDRVRQSGEKDEAGRPVAAVPASDKYALAKRAGVDLEFVEQRFDALCDIMPLEDEHVVVPRYRLKDAAMRPHAQENLR
jgi:hypothetical protein